MALSLGDFLLEGSPEGCAKFPIPVPSQNPARNLPILHLPYRQAAVLVAIAIPVFTTQLEKSREATDLANLRSAYAAVVTQWLDQGSATTATVSAQQKVAGWQNSAGSLEVMKDGVTSPMSITPITNSSWTVSVDSAGSITVTP